MKDYTLEGALQFRKWLAKKVVPIRIICMELEIKFQKYNP